MRACEVDGCDARHKGRGLCERHNSEARRSMAGPTGPLPAVDWHGQTACRDLPLDMFFQPEESAETSEALRVCAACPVKTECLDYALEAREAFGVWGGMTASQLGRLRKGRPAGRRREERAA